MFFEELLKMGGNLEDIKRKLKNIDSNAFIQSIVQNLEKKQKAFMIRFRFAPGYFVFIRL